MDKEYEYGIFSKGDGMYEEHISRDLIIDSFKNCITKGITCRDCFWKDCQICEQKDMVKIPAYLAYNVSWLLEALCDPKNTITHEAAVDFLLKEGWLQEHDRILMESGKGSAKKEEG